MDTPEAGKQFIREYMDALSDKPKPRETLSRFVSDPALIAHIEQVEQAFPNYRLTIRHMIAENDWVAVRATFTGVQRGEFAGIPATGSEAEAEAIIFYRIQDQRIVEHHLQFDVSTLMRQLRSGAVLA